jgi:hypothetical protein
MKTIANFEVLKRNDKAVLIKTNVEELNQELTFWLQLSEVTFEDSTIQVDDDAWFFLLRYFRKKTDRRSF